MLGNHVVVGKTCQAVTLPYGAIGAVDSSTVTKSVGNITSQSCGNLQPGSFLLIASRAN